MSHADALLTLGPDDCAQAVAAVIAAARPDGRANGRLTLDPEAVERDLARLVLAVLEFLRQLMELQAIRRMERGALTPEEEERVGDALMRSSARLRELAAAFGLADEDLTLDLGPLGRLV